MKKSVEQLVTSLNAEQQLVATTFDVPVVVLAGAGTGKTRAITHRIAYGALTRRLIPHQTLAVTFTVKAAHELRERLAALGVPGVQARTFHSAALRQLRHFWPLAYGNDLPVIAGSTRGIVAEALRMLQLDASDMIVRDVSSEISWAKVSNVSPEDYPELATRARRSVPSLDHEQIAHVMEQYEGVKRRRRVIDFDDVLLCAVAMYHEHPRIAEQFRAHYRFFTVDEYQDVSPLQQALLELWLGDREDICIVGDTNQAIHSFAGADPTFLSTFHTKYPNASVISMRTNYRSTEEILRVSNTLISRQQRLTTVVGSGPEVTITPSLSEADERDDLAAWLLELRQAGVDWADMAVLYRVNSQADELRDTLERFDIPTRLADVDASTDNQPSSAVQLSTMHAAKGLEWQAVAVIGVSEGFIPLAYAETDEQIDEEKRLLYVAMTRARRFLRLSWARGGASGASVRPVSRFLPSKLTSRTPATTGSSARKPRATRSMPRCRVCGGHLDTGSQIKLGRHDDCLVAFDPELVDALKSWRSTQAKRQQMPAFVVFTDATVQAIAEQLPASADELRQIPGIGYVKAAKYGDEVLQLVARYNKSR